MKPKPVFGALLGLVGLLVMAPRATAASSVEDYRQCMMQCSSSYVQPGETGVSCEESLKRIADDLSKIFELLNVPRICRGRYAAACDSWRTATLDRLGKLIPLLRDLTWCGEAEVEKIMGYAETFDCSRTCKGDGVYSDLHDYCGSNRELLDSLANHATSLMYAAVRIDPMDDLQGHTPNCDTGGTPSPLYVPAFLRIFHSLESLKEVAACAAQCKKPSEARSRTEGLLAKADQLSGSLSKLGAALKVAETARNEPFIRQAMEPYRCSAFTRLGMNLAETGKQLESIIEELKNELSGEPRAEIVVRQEQNLENLQKDLSGYDPAAAAAACVDEDKLAMSLEEKKRLLVDRISKDPSFGLEAVETFDRGHMDGGKCRWTIDCRMPGVCQKSKCTGAGLAVDLGAQLAELKKLEEGILAIKLHDENGLRPDGMKMLEDSEKALTDLQKQLVVQNWGKSVREWKQSFVGSIEAKTRVFGDQARVTLDSLDELGGAHPENPRRCGSSRERLRSTIRDMQGLSQSLKDLDPVGNARWVAVQLARVNAVASQVEGSQKEAVEDCREAAFNPMLLLYVVLGLAVAGLAVFGFLRYRRVYLKYRPRKRRQ